MFKNKIFTREDLKNFFRNGRIPSENHFSNLIDSMINKQDDGFSKDDENGLMISTRGSSKRFVTFYKNMDDLSPFFYLEKDDQETDGLRFTPFTNSREDKEENDSFFLHSNGAFGIGTRCGNDFRLQVNGFAGMEGRVGTFLQGQVPADGRWHALIEGLDNCQAFEVVARVGKKSSGRFAILHAYALSAFGRSRSKIKKVSAHYGSWWNKIGIRWKSKNTHDYALHLCTNLNYGADVFIQYRVTKLWDDEKFVTDKSYY
jgi:hypothetical protein